MNVLRPAIWYSTKLAASIVTVALAASGQCISAQAPQPDGAGLERGVLPTSWAESPDACASRKGDFRLHEYNSELYILRQTGCTNYEKPFVYLIFGDGQALMIDTGAKGANVADAVRDALAHYALAHGGKTPTLVVAHSHAHGDHVAGDSALALLPNTTVVGRTPEAVHAFFHLNNWPEEPTTYALGTRVLDIVPIPGHERSSIAVYDRRTGLLLTGDTMYPGRLYVADGAAFIKSVHRLVDFTRGKPIAHILGAHIEESRTPFLDYPIGTKFQPEEHILELSRGQLLELSDALDRMNGNVIRQAMRDFTIWPNMR